MTVNDPHQVLGVPTDATEDDLRRAYREKARRIHPDQNGSPEAEDAFKQLNAAYRQLLGGGMSEQDELVPPPGEPTLNELLAGLGGLVRKAKTAVRGKRGNNLEIAIAVPFKEAAKGLTRRVKLAHATVTFPVPAGTRDGRKLKVVERGHPHPDGDGKPGDLIIAVRVEPDAHLRRDGDDILCEAPVTVFEAALGAAVEVTTINGLVALRIPPGTQSGERIVIPKAGIASRGDQIVTIVVETPTGLGQNQRAALSELAESLGLGAHPLTAAHRVGDDEQ